MWTWQVVRPPFGKMNDFSSGKDSVRVSIQFSSSSTLESAAKEA